MEVGRMLLLLLLLAFLLVHMALKFQTVKI
jgi:hypothetical protein